MNATESANFVDRRNHQTGEQTDWVERRQFAESRETLSPEVRELAEAIDAFKRAHHRRYITLAEVLEVVRGLGYHK